jgi:hypothetical protein
VTEAPEVIVRSQKAPDVSVRLVDPQFVDEHETVFIVDAHADGLHARVRDMTVRVWDREYLPDFLDGLAADFRGWTGERSWGTDQLTLRASFHSGGHVELTWILRPWAPHQNQWEASVITWVEGGEQLTAPAADVRDLLARPGTL